MNLRNMKNKYLHTCFVFLGLLAFLSACEKNDPLTELGKEVSNKVPFVTTSGIQNLYAADDTVLFRVYYWSASDNIDKLVLSKGEVINASGNLVVDDGGGPVTVNIAFEMEKEMQQEGTDIAHDPLDYETARNAYNKAMSYHIDPQYQLLELEDPEELGAIDALANSQEIKENIVKALQDNGVIISAWEEIHNITTGIALKIESTLSFQMQVIDAVGQHNVSAVTTVKVGALD